LFAGLAAESQASRVAAVVSRQLLKPGGLAATTVNTGQQWDSPNGWAPLQWIAVAGFRRYNQTQIAEEIACRWMANVSRAYRSSNRLVEKYDVITPDRPGGGGEYPLQDGFGWTNGVMSKLMMLYPQDAADSSAASCPGAPATSLR
jgi:alpha,alpha-trehalase